MRDYKHAVFIGRFQPFHKSHLAVVEQGLEIADHLIIVVGSANAARSVKNPLSSKERELLILESIPDALRGRVSLVGVRDYYYNQDAWLASVQAATDRWIRPGDSVALLGSFKDASSFYLNCFPQWDHIPSLPGSVHGADIRELMYESSKNEYGHIMPRWDGTLEVDVTSFWAIEPMVCGENPINMLIDFSLTKEFANLCKEWEFNKRYKASWKDAPFPPTFVTVDAVVTCSGHVLIVKRKLNPGKGLYALPGGFLKQSETIAAGAVRELREETGIRVTKDVLQIVDSHVFDHPDRSQRGRTITHAHYIPLPVGPLPEVKGGDDASKAFWMPMWDVHINESNFFEDHAHIINYFVGVQ